MAAAKWEVMSGLPRERITAGIHTVRNQHVMLDSDLATLYGVEVRALDQAVSRNLNRFPEDFMFQLTSDEAIGLRSQT